MSPLRTERLSRRNSDAAAHPYARRYGDALRVADSAMAGQVVDEALAAGLSAAAVQSLVIAPALVWIGELWAANAATVSATSYAGPPSGAIDPTIGWEAVR